MWVSRKNTTLKRTKGQGWGSSPRHLLILYTCQLNSWGRNIKKQTNRKKKQTWFTESCTTGPDCGIEPLHTDSAAQMEEVSISNFLIADPKLFCPWKKKSHSYRQDPVLSIFFLVCLKIFPNYQFYEEQKTREGAGILINFSADTMFNLRLYFHF